MQEHLQSTSPGGGHILSLEELGEIRFGPVYYEVMLGGHLVAGRVFGRPILWEPSGKFVALQEWLTTSEASGPNTTLSLIDAEKSRIARLSPVAGFVFPIAFETGMVIYKKEFSTGTIGEYEVRIEDVLIWKDIRTIK